MCVLQNQAKVSVGLSGPEALATVRDYWVFPEHLEKVLHSNGLLLLKPKLGVEDEMELKSGALGFNGGH